MRDGARTMLRELKNLGRPGGPAGGRLQSWNEQAVIASVTAGAAADGNALVTVTWRGVVVQASYLSSYTPVVGHTVAAVIQPPSLPLILGRVIGTPP